MTEPLRQITVDGVRLRWRFNERLVVILPELGKRTAGTAGFCPFDFGLG